MKRSLSLLPSAGFVLALLLIQGGCATSSKTTKGSASQESTKLSGKVVETVDSGGYTYICLEKDGKKTWVALTTMKVKVGDELNLMPGAEMNNFTSKTLNRTFDKVIFSGGLAVSPADKKAADKKAAEKKAEDKKAAPTKLEPPVLSGKVVETMNAKVYTYLKIEKDGKAGWTAVPNTTIKVGDEVEVLPGTDMGSFTSGNLGRTFENIHFSDGLVSVNGVAKAAEPAAKDAESKMELPSGHPAMPAQNSALPAGHPALPQQAPAAAAAPAAPPVSGQVIETMDAGGYSYVLLEQDGKKTWVAAPPMKATVGQQLSFLPGMEMSKFTSKSLNRTFDKIIFTNGLVKQ
jgi:hypothetical protein